MACVLPLSLFSAPSPSPSPSPCRASSQCRGLCVVCFAFPQSRFKSNSNSNSKGSPPQLKSRSRSKSQPHRGPATARPKPPPPSTSSTTTTTTERRQDTTARKRHWKAGEFPALSLSSHSDAHPINGNTTNSNFNSNSTTRSPIKNLKKKLQQRERARAWVCTVTEALADAIRLKDCLRALDVFRMLRHQPFYEPKPATYIKLLVLLGRSGHPALARQLFAEMLQEGLQPTPALYTALLAAYCRNNLIDDAFQVLNTMKASPLCHPDVYTYSTLIKACVDAARFDLVDALYQDMADRSITPNTVTQNTVLSGYGKAGKFDDMERILTDMLQNPNCTPDVWTMNVILSLFGNMGLLDNMEKWYEKFRNYGIEPETRTFNILIGAYGKKKMYDKMSAVMEYMRRLNVPWTSSTYNNIIEAFADVGDAKNMEHSFSQMRAEGMKPDTKTFCCLINGYSNAGMFHKVVSTIQFAERNEVHATAAFHNAVMAACAKAGDLLEMERVFKRMKERGCVPDEQTYAVLIEAYRKEGMSDKIFDLQQSDPTLFTAVHS